MMCENISRMRKSLVPCKEVEGAKCLTLTCFSEISGHFAVPFQKSQIPAKTSHACW